MILELVDIRIHPGQQDAFDEAIERGVRSVIAQSPGFLGYSVHKGIESPERYVLTIRWNRLEDHMETFRGGPLFTEWRSIVGPFFAEPPKMEHFHFLTPHQS